MAEFQEVMRQWVRARKATCGITGEYEHLSNRALNYWTDECIAQLEKDVMQWAAEHPEPVYPTWLEFVKCRKAEGRIEETDSDFVLWMAENRIPADIAQKLGIQPKEETV